MLWLVVVDKAVEAEIVGVEVVGNQAAEKLCCCFLVLLLLLVLKLVVCKLYDDAVLIVM